MEVALFGVILALIVFIILWSINPWLVLLFWGICWVFQLIESLKEKYDFKQEMKRKKL